METGTGYIDNPEKYKFVLFISGMSIKSTHAIENIRRICDEYLPEAELQIIDINEEKQHAVNYQIIGIPTLIKTHPLPVRMILGDLSDTNKVLKILDIKP